MRTTVLKSGWLTIHRSLAQKPAIFLAHFNAPCQLSRQQKLLRASAKLRQFPQVQCCKDVVLLSSIILPSTRFLLGSHCLYRNILQKTTSLMASRRHLAYVCYLWLPAAIVKDETDILLYQPPSQWLIKYCKLICYGSVKTTLNRW